MKKCPQCGREYDNTMSFCLDDGSELLYGPASTDEPATAILSEPPALAGGQSDEAKTRAFIHTTQAEGEPRQSVDDASERPSPSAHRAAKPRSQRNRLLAICGIGVLLIVGGFFGYRYFVPAKQIESIAVMRFVNESGNADVEYLSDGMTETLINSLS